MTLLLIQILPSIGDTFVILKPKSEWPDPSMTKDQLISVVEESLNKLPGNNIEISQPIQLRMGRSLLQVLREM